MQRLNVHIVPNSGGWDLKLENSKDIIIHHENKDLIILCGRAYCYGRLSLGGKSELTIHKKDGTIENKNTYGDDPPEIKG